MKLRSGIRLLNEIQGSGRPLADLELYDAILKFYRNRGEPLNLPTPIIPSRVPYIERSEGGDKIVWRPPNHDPANIVELQHGRLARQDDLLPGIYYSLLGMQTGGYRFVAIPPHLFAHSMYECLGIDRESIVKLELFLTWVTTRSES